MHDEIIAEFDAALTGIDAAIAAEPDPERRNRLEADRQRIVASLRELTEPATTGRDSLEHLTDEQITEAIRNGEPMPSPPGCSWRRHKAAGGILGPRQRR